MTAPVARVFYEDQRGPVTEFGLHALVLACVADRTGDDRWALRERLPCFPKKGDSKLLAVCREEAADWSRDGKPIFALFDEDRVRRLVGLDREACRGKIVDAIRQSSTATESVRVVLLRQNLESVLEALGACGAADVTLVESAIETKDHNARDSLLHRAASADGGVRQRILERLPSLGRLVAGLVRELAPSDREP